MMTAKISPANAQRAATKAAERKAFARLDRICQTALDHVQIPMMKIPNVYNVAKAAAAAGDHDTVIAAKVRAYINTIKV